MHIINTEWTRHDLRDWRQRRNIKQADLAKMLGKTLDTVSRWERGQHPLPAGLHAAIVKLNANIPDPDLKDPEWVCFNSCPHLYVEVMDRNKRYLHQTAEHPVKLIERQLLDPDAVAMRPATAFGKDGDEFAFWKATWTILQHPAYQRAVERWRGLSPQAKEAAILAADTRESYWDQQSAYVAWQKSMPAMQK